MTSTNLKNALFGLVMLAAGLFLLHTAIASPWEGPTEEDPMFLARILLVIWVLLAALITVSDLRKKESILPPIRWSTLLPVMLLLACAAVLMPVVGFIPVCLAFFPAYAFVTGYRKLRLLLPLSAVFTAVTWYVFQFLLEIQLPPIPFLE